MRGLFAASMLMALMAVAPAARAAPTCQTRAGVTIRCGAEGAMPVGWTLPPEEQVNGPAIEDAGALFKVILGLGLFFAMIALLPPFDGSQTTDWGRQEGDED